MSERTLNRPKARLGLTTTITEPDARTHEDGDERLAGNVVLTRAARIVVAEDDDEMRRLLVQVLRLDGHDVVEASTGVELLARLGSFWARGEDPDLIVSDVRMPGCSGLQVLSLLRGDGRLSPVILITAFGDRELHERAAELGATGVIDKPFDVGAFGELVRNVLVTKET